MQVLRTIARCLAFTALLSCSSTEQTEPGSPRSDAISAIAQALNEAYKHCYEERWGTALGKVEWMLRVDPEYAFARYLLARITAWEVAPPEPDTLVYDLERWTKMTDTHLGHIPQAETFHSPAATMLDRLKSAEGAPMLRSRAPKAMQMSDPESYLEYDYDADLYRKLRSLRMTETGSTFSHFIDALRYYSGLNIGLKKEALDMMNANAPCQFSLNSATLVEALDQALPPLGLRAWVKYGVVLIGQK